VKTLFSIAQRETAGHAIAPRMSCEPPTRFAAGAGPALNRA
jgi:hypothetical protein